MQAYSNPERAFDPYALPDIEVFLITSAEALERNKGLDVEDHYEPGWYWWACFPGCLPDGEPNGPFLTAEDAMMDARRED
jgi:hypothetical protein